MDTSPSRPASAAAYCEGAENPALPLAKPAETLPIVGKKMLERENDKPDKLFCVRTVEALSTHANIVDRIIQNQNIGLTVDDDSRQSMAEALRFSGIDTLEQAEYLHLRVIPPGPVFHTWYARYKTGLFDGGNNPAHVEGLDYVTRVAEQASRLKEWGIPVMLIYLERDMPDSELRKMRELFSKHENILVMSLEGDLSSLKCTEHYKSEFVSSLLDEPRFSLCSEFPDLLLLAQRKAESVGKMLLLENLKALGGQSIIYSDIDNTLIHRPMFQLAAYGYRFVCPFRKEFSLQDDKEFGRYSDENTTSELAETIKDLFAHESVTGVRKKRVLTTAGLKDKAERLYDYLYSGMAVNNYKILNPGSVYESECIFRHEGAGYIVVNKDALAVANQADQWWSGVDWYCSLVEKQDLDNQLLNLHGLQQLKQVHIGRDETWRNT